MVAEAAAWPVGKPAGSRFEVTVHVVPPPVESAIYFGANGTSGDDLPWPQGA